ncbi:histidine kinase [Streptomyces pimonensis]|uniref:histidine kinase n=1 Tax=Streptomyces pimonensis TaxID=2860288 RepID=A0ABV4J0R7_9ACTN
MQSLRNWLLPVLLAVPDAVIVSVLVLPGDEPAGVLELVGLIAALVLQLVALGRRRREPLRALAGALAASLIGNLTAPDHFVGLGPSVALYSVAVRCGGRVTAVGTAASVGCRWLPDVVYGGPPRGLLTGLATYAVLEAACVCAGKARRQWLSGRRAAAGRLAHAQETRRQAAETERHRLARELHDVSAHHLTSVVVTVDAARRLAGKRPELVEEALAFAARGGRETLTSLRRLAAVMRGTDLPDPRPMSGRVRELVAGFSRLGRPIDTELPDDLAGPAAEAVFGILREALTNALRHAPGAAVSVRIRRDADTLELTVGNGPPRTAAHRPAAGLGSGNGLTGMRERAAALGGDLEAGPERDGGWRVTARLPDSTGPRPPGVFARRRDFLREQRLADALLMVTAVVTPLFPMLTDTANGGVVGGPSDGAVLTLLVSVHAAPLWWRRRAPWTALCAVAATVWLVPAAYALDLLPREWVGLTPAVGVAEAMAVYAVAAYGRGALRALGGVLLATASLVGAVTAAAADERVLAPVLGGRGAAVWTAFLVLCAAVPSLLALWGAGVAVRRRRIRVVAREEGAFADSVRAAAEEAAAERRRIAAELHATVLERTTHMVESADRGELDEVATGARSALAAMRELLGGLRGAVAPAGQHAPQPTAADLVDLCRTPRPDGRTVTLSGLPRAADGLPPAVSLTVYHVVEAALGAGDRGPARVRLRRRRGRVHLTVTGVPLAVAGPVGERLRVRIEGAEGEMAADRAGVLRVSLPAGELSAPAEETVPTPHA